MLLTNMVKLNTVPWLLECLTDHPGLRDLVVLQVPKVSKVSKGFPEETASLATMGFLDHLETCY